MNLTLVDNPESTKYYYVTGDTTDDWIILVISVLIIIIIWGIILFLSVSSVPDIVNNTGGQVFVNCPTGQCATNIYTGEKRCPTVEGTITSNAGFEVCNSRYSCDNFRTPFSIKSDGSIDTTGQCKDGVECRCVSRPRCPEYITSFFKSSQGNPYGGISNTRTTFVQETDWTDPFTGQTTNNRPLEYDSVSTEFCTVPSLWLLRSSPGCNFAETNSIENITKCMGYQSGCDNVTYNPCSVGTLAFIMDDASQFTSESVDSIPMGCVAAEPCDCGETAIWDRGYNGVVCRTIDS